MLVLFGLAWWNTVSAEPSELYQRLGLEKAATSAEIRRAYHAQARHTHPDKVEGDKAVAAEKFKRLAEAYEVLTDKKLRVEYDRTGQIPDDRAKSAANQQSTGEEEEFGYGGARPAPSAPQQWGRRYESYDAFEVRLAQGRARRARSLAQLRKHLHAPNGTALRYGLVGFYRAGDEAALKEGLKFPYPFAGWSLGREGSGFWCELQIAITLTLALALTLTERHTLLARWEDEIQTFLVPIGASSNEQSDLLRHFGLSVTPTPTLSPTLTLTLTLTTDPDPEH